MADRPHTQQPSGETAACIHTFRAVVSSRGWSFFTVIAKEQGLSAPPTQTPHTRAPNAQGTSNSSLRRLPLVADGGRASQRRRAAASPAAAPRRRLSQAQLCGSSARAQGTGGGGGATLQLRAALCTSDGTSVVALVMSCMVAAMLAHAALTASLTPVRMRYAHGRWEPAPGVGMGALGSQTETVIALGEPGSNAPPQLVAPHEGSPVSALSARGRPASCVRRLYGQGAPTYGQQWLTVDATTVGTTRGLSSTSASRTRS